MAKINKYILLCCFVLLIVFAGVVVINTPFFAIFSINGYLNGDIDIVNSINLNKKFGSFVYASIDKKVFATNNNEVAQIKVDLKLFNLITLKSFTVKNEEIELYVGGDVMGFTLSGEGVVIIGSSNVESENGKINTLIESDIKKGDILKKIEGEKITSVADICRIVNRDENKSKKLKIEIKREEKIIETNILNALDKNSGIYKLGLWVKDDVSGIGTLTYIKKDDGKFGALGHAICDNDTKTVYNIEGGDMYPCTVIGIKKGLKGKPGEIKGLFMQGNSNKRGEIYKNCEYGVFGKVYDEKMQYGKNCLLAGGRLYAKPGKAYIHSSIDGNTAKDYEIEIIKTNYQSCSNEKSLVIKVTDKELLQKTGGIIQGMSGSPIIQNGRIIGAVTHVFINDPTKGFGVYLDWMLDC